MMDKRVLFISYNFPPHGGPGVQRSLKFVKYLPEFCWQPVVIAAEAENALVQDPTLLDDIPPDICVERFPGFSMRRLYRISKRYRLDRPLVAANVLLQLPDAARIWAMSARRRVLAVLKRERPDVIYTTSGPYSTHLLGRWLRRQTGLPWFADFRDPWSKNLLSPYPPGYRRLNARLERKVLSDASRVACVSQPWLEDLRQNLGRDTRKFLVLPNGYDDEDIKPLPRRSAGDRFTIVHYGSFYRNRRPGNVVSAVRLVADRARIPYEQIRLIFVGRNSRDVVPDEPPFERVDYVPYRQLDAFREKADVLLLILDTAPGNVGNYSGKIYEYVASNRPILAVVPPGGVAEDLVNQTRTGVTVGGDPSAIAEAIETLYLQWRDPSVEWSPNWDFIQRHTRRALTERLAHQFDSMLQETQ